MYQNVDPVAQANPGLIAPPDPTRKPTPEEWAAMPVSAQASWNLRRGLWASARFRPDD